jgi:hypothetical protein
MKGGSFVRAAVLVIPTYLAVCTCRNSVHHHRCDRAWRDLSRTADLCPLQLTHFSVRFQSHVKRAAKNWPGPWNRSSSHRIPELSCVGLLPKSLLRSVERAYLRRRQPWEEATTIKTLVPGLSPHGIVDRTVQPWRVRLGYGVVTADPCGRTRTPKLIVVSSLISRGARQLTRNPEMHFFALIRQFT